MGFLDMLSHLNEIRALELHMNRLHDTLECSFFAFVTSSSFNLIRNELYDTVSNALTWLQTLLRLDHADVLVPSSPTTERRGMGQSQPQ